MRKRKAEWATAPSPVSYERAGVTYHGTYRVQAGMIRVSFQGAYEETQLGGLAASPEDLARTLLSELVEKAARRS